MIWHIFKKDLRLLWRAVLGVFLANFIARCVLPHMSGFASEGVELARIGNLLATGILIVLVVHEDLLPGYTQDWLVRPIARADLLLSKLLFVVLLVQGPIFAAEFTYDLISGFPLGPSLWTALSRSFWMLLAVDLPWLALAAVTRNLVEALGAVLVALVGFAVFWDMTFNAVFYRWTGSAWVIEWLQIACGVVASGVVLWLQYRRRRTNSARCTLAAAVGIWFAVQLLPWSSIFAIQEWFSGDPGAAQRVQIVFDPASRNLQPHARPSGIGQERQILIPLKVEGLGGGRTLFTDRAVVRLIGQDGNLIDAGQDAMAETFGPTPTNQTIQIRDDVFSRIQSQPLTLDLDYSLTLLQSAAGQELPADRGVRWIPNIGFCAAHDDAGSAAVELHCVSPGSPPCTSWRAEGSPAAPQLPAMIHMREVGIRTSRPCKSDYAPYAAQIQGESSLRVRTGLAATGSARLVPLIYTAQAHFRRRVTIRDIRLSDWLSEDDRANP